MRWKAAIYFRDAESWDPTPGADSIPRVSIAWSFGRSDVAPRADPSSPAEIPLTLAISRSIRFQAGSPLLLRESCGPIRGHRYTEKQQILCHCIAQKRYQRAARGVNQPCTAASSCAAVNPARVGMSRARITPWVSMT